MGKLARMLLVVVCLSAGAAPVVLAQVGPTTTQPIAPPGPGPGGTGTGSALGSAAATTAAPTVDSSGPGNVYNRQRASADRSIRRGHAAPARERACVAGDSGRGVRGHGGRPAGLRDGAVVHDAVAHRAVAVVVASGGAQRPGRTACAGRRHQCDGTIAFAGRDRRDAVDRRTHDRWGGAWHRDPVRQARRRRRTVPSGIELHRAPGRWRAAVAGGRGRGR